MDNLTHTLVGAALGEAGLKRRSALATPVLLIGANLPDVDIVAALFDQTLPFRRGWTHGVLAIFVLPILLTGAAIAWHHWVRRGASTLPFRPRQLILVAFAAVLSHPFLDWLNTYGLRWLMPFDGTWFYGDALFIIDPWVWLALILGLLIARRRRDPRTGLVTLSVVGIYIVAMLSTAAYGRRFVDHTMRDRGVEPDAVMVGPVPADPFRRQVIVRVDSVYLTGDLHLLPRRELRLVAPPVPANLNHPVARAAALTPEVQRFLTWSRFPFVVVDDNGNAYSVRVDDLRYSGRGRGSFATIRLEIPREAVAGPSSAEPRAGGVETEAR